MKRITDKPWFGKKYFGWGLRPVSWEGWIVTLVFLMVVIIDLTYFKINPISIAVFIAATLVFVAAAILTGDKPGSVMWEEKEKRPLLISASLVILVVVIFCVYQIHMLDVAHSSFENYYNFRGCVQLLEKTDTYGICKLSSGQTIKLVKYKNKWYLDGDLPYPGFNFL